MICHNCGNEISDFAKVCPLCNVSLQSQLEPLPMQTDCQMPSPQMEGVPYGSYAPQRWHKRKRFQL